MSPGRKGTSQSPTSRPRTRTDRVRSASGASANGSGASDEDVRRRAYELWEARGREEGHDLDDWCRAEDELRNYRVATDQSGPVSG